VGTDGPGGGKFNNATELAVAVAAAWPRATGDTHRYVVCTGGEPLLQLDEPAIDALHAEGFEIGVETNGTIPAPQGIDWLCVSPKGRAGLEQRSGDELKLVYPQVEDEARPECFESLPFDHFYLQPLDDDHKEANTKAAIAYCLEHPRWRLSLQTHKIVGID
jgi:7-carboxy-7-deazaguanine synthase (Cx14CxxC type)